MADVPNEPDCCRACVFDSVSEHTCNSPDPVYIVGGDLFGPESRAQFDNLCWCVGPVCECDYRREQAQRAAVTGGSRPESIKPPADNDPSMPEPS